MRLLGATMTVCGLVIGGMSAASCADDDDPGANEPLAPIVTTSTVATTLPPTTTQPRFYEVQTGDTLSAIAAAYGLPIQAIAELNNIIDPNSIQVGQILELPLASEVVVTSLPPITTVPGPTALPAVTAPPP